MKGKIQLAHLDDTELSDATKQLSSEPPMALYVNQFITLKKNVRGQNMYMLLSSLASLSSVSSPVPQSP